MGAKTWQCYNQNRVITSSVIKGLKCTFYVKSQDFNFCKYFLKNVEIKRFTV